MGLLVQVGELRVGYERAGDAAYERTENLIAEQPVFTVPTIVIGSLDDPVTPPTSRATHAPHFTRLVDYRQLATGHNTPQEDPEGFADAIVTLHRATRLAAADRP